jgi:catechol 2,3-dioxygenase-like lactoylglutathione lyase family enzyme
MIDHLDHLVLTTARPSECIDFYIRVLGMTLESFVGGSPPVLRNAFKFGEQKINLHIQGSEFEPKAYLPVPGSQDLCFIASISMEQIVNRLTEQCWPVIEGPIQRTGAIGKIMSVYVRDPDLNLIEISVQL